MRFFAIAGMRLLLLGAVLLVGAVLPAVAQYAADAGARANAGTVGVVSGGVDGTYVRIAADLSAVLDDGDRLRVLTLLGKGSLQNMADIIYLKGIDIGIVQSDVLAYAKRQHVFPAWTRLYSTSPSCTTRKCMCWPGPALPRLPTSPARR
jgi:hypothetical protein